MYNKSMEAYRKDPDTNVVRRQAEELVYDLTRKVIEQETQALEQGFEVLRRHFGEIAVKQAGMVHITQVNELLTKYLNAEI